MSALTNEGMNSDASETSILSDTVFLNDLRRQMVKFCDAATFQ